MTFWALSMGALHMVEMCTLWQAASAVFSKLPALAQWDGIYLANTKHVEVHVTNANEEKSDIKCDMGWMESHGKLFIYLYKLSCLTHWGWVMHICISNLTIMSSNDGLLSGRRQVIIQTNAGILLIGLLGTNFSENLIEIITFSVKKMCLKVSSAKRLPFCLCLNVLTHCDKT